MYSFGDIIKVLQEGIPFSGKDFKIQLDQHGSSIVSGKLIIPLEKIKDITFEDSIESHLRSMMHPLLRFNFSMSNEVEVNSNHLVVNFMLCIETSRIDKIAKEIEDSNFHSALEKALTS